MLKSISAWAFDPKRSAAEIFRIARDCGFAHQSHFTSRFKQASGLTPTRCQD